MILPIFEPVLEGYEVSIQVPKEFHDLPDRHFEWREIDGGCRGSAGTLWSMCSLWWFHRLCGVRGGRLPGESAIYFDGLVVRGEKFRAGFRRAEDSFHDQTAVDALALREEPYRQFLDELLLFVMQPKLDGSATDRASWGEGNRPW